VHLTAGLVHEAEVFGDARFRQYSWELTPWWRACSWYVPRALWRGSALLDPTRSQVPPACPRPAHVEEGPWWRRVRQSGLRYPLRELQPSVHSEQVVVRRLAALLLRLWLRRWALAG
jgi:hypothetical protein